MFSVVPVVGSPEVGSEVDGQLLCPSLVDSLDGVTLGGDRC